MIAKYYDVVCKCGHVGRNKYAERHFPVMAYSKKEAASYARDFSRVKHDHKDAIISVTEISKDKYTNIYLKNQCDPYFFCHCIQEQRYYVIDNIHEEVQEDDKERKKENSRINIYHNKIKIRNPKKYYNKYINYCEEYVS